MVFYLMYDFDSFRIGEWKTIYTHLYFRSLPKCPEKKIWSRYTDIHWKLEWNLPFHSFFVKTLEAFPKISSNFDLASSSPTNDAIFTVTYNAANHILPQYELFNIKPSYYWFLHKFSYHHRSNQPDAIHCPGIVGLIRKTTILYHAITIFIPNQTLRHQQPYRGPHGLHIRLILCKQVIAVTL